MKKILVLFLLLFAVQVQAAGIYTTVASGTVASADIAVTLTAGSANVDLSSATIPRNYKGHLIRIYDANNVMIQGYVYTDGSGTVQNIVNTKGGTTRNWASQGAGFDDTTNCRYEIIKVRQLPVIATHSITAGNALIDATEANAFAAPVGVDLSAYQDGRHMLALCDSSGYAAIAHISATAPGGEALGDELITSWTNGDSAFDTLTVNANGHDITALINLSDKVASTYTNINMVVGELYKIVTDVTVTSGTAPSLRTKRGAGGSLNQTISNAVSDATYYWTASTVIDTGKYDTGLTLYGTLAVNMSILISQKKMTTPPATGVLLLSRKGGDRGWLYKHASFNPNSAITAKILYVGD